MLFSHLSKVISSCLVIGCLSYIKAELKTLTPNLDFGIIEANDDLVPLSWTITNSGDHSLRLMCIDNNYPHTIVSLSSGIMASKASTVVHGSFNPKNTVGPICGTIEIIPEHGHTIALNFRGEVKPDLEPRTSLKAIIKNIDGQTRIVASNSLLFTTRSGAPINPNIVSINSEPYIGADLEVNNDHLYITPYIYTPSLPNCQDGCAIITLRFKYDIGTLTYNIPVSWERNDPLRIVKVAPRSYAVSYADNCKFNIRKLTVAPGLIYKTYFSNDGTTLFLEPATIKIKSLQQHRKRSVTFIKRSDRPVRAKIKPMCFKSLNIVNANNIIRPNSKPKYDSEVLIKLETTHPYRSEVTINSD